MHGRTIDATGFPQQCAIRVFLSSVVFDTVQRLNSDGNEVFIVVHFSRSDVMKIGEIDFCMLDLCAYVPQVYLSF